MAPTSNSAPPGRLPDISQPVAEMQIDADQAGEMPRVTSEIHNSSSVAPADLGRNENEVISEGGLEI
ncbi:unnamed protein product [Linum trigynum]|uniref:Uncharacterized protein n=1 Tax=Linum trigynum TaxID=586398 RepID=A0AAV2GJG4_9ROSI